MLVFFHIRMCSLLATYLREPGLWSRNSNFRLRLQFQASKSFGSSSGSNLKKCLVPSPELLDSIKNSKTLYFSYNSLVRQTRAMEPEHKFQLRLHSLVVNSTWLYVGVNHTHQNYKSGRVRA